MPVRSQRPMDVKVMCVNCPDCLTDDRHLDLARPGYEHTSAGRRERIEHLHTIRQPIHDSDRCLIWTAKSLSAPTSKDVMTPATCTLTKSDAHVGVVLHNPFIAGDVVSRHRPRWRLGRPVATFDRLQPGAS